MTPAFPEEPSRRTEAGVRVPLWQPHDFTFRSAVRLPNPFTLGFSAEVRRPDGSHFIIPGFYDGNGTWKVRISPDEEGNWSLITRSEDPELDAKPVSYTCVRDPNSTLRGGLRVDPRYQRHFVREDGTHFFLLGYECDWLWALDMNDPKLPTVNRFLDTLAAHGFNYLILNAYAHDTRWRQGKTGPDDYGPPPMYAWEGTNENPDHSRMNLAYWQHYDRIMEALHRRGIIAHLMIKVYNKQVQWPATGSPEDDLYFRWLIARYAAYPNVVWDFSKEAHKEKNLEYKLGRLRFLRQHDPYRRLITVHDDDGSYDSGAYNELLDYRSDQQHSRWHETLLAQRQQREWPLLNVEFGYEHGPGGLTDKTYNVAQSPEEVCRRAWEVCAAGAYPVYYYTYTAWDVIRPDDRPPGYISMKRLKEFWEETGYWRLQPADDRVSEGHCLADPGSEYVVFLNQARPFTLRLDRLSRPLPAEWYDPLHGRRASAGQLSGETAELRPPGEWGEGPVALHVGQAPSGKPPDANEDGRAGVRADAVFPLKDWEESTPESQGVDSTKLAGAVEYLKAHAGGDGARELVMVRNGRLIWKGDQIDKVHGIWSCTKSFTSTCLGLLIDDGKCSLDTPAARFVPELAEHYPKVTLRHFTTMTSGYRAAGDEPTGDYKHGPSPTPFQPDPRPLFTPPGSQYAYWDSAMNLFGLVLTRIAGEPLKELFKRRIADPIGMNPTHWEWGEWPGDNGVVVNSGSGNLGKQIHLSAREMARLGHLFLNEGNWNGRQLISADWVRQATAVHVSASLPWAHPESGFDGRGCYGCNWWVNGSKVDGKRLWPGAPAGTYMASGHNNNRLIVVPEWNMVLVRLGLDQKDKKLTDEALGAFLSQIGEALHG